MRQTRAIMEPKKMSVAEFRRLGYLQELNRKFLHPLGLALEVNVDDDGTESFGEVWDCRNDPEGMLFDDSMIDDEFIERARIMEQESWDRYRLRKSILGFNVQSATIQMEDSNGGFK